ncbi:MAG TPA: hypothetical protein DCW60_00770, partial [Sutterella sp.]|nr:hypothetical protein [Sutterella sp.]
SVKDDGSGIEKDDLALALTRHATSKIANLGDLEDVRTYGFRGEALASIASVADVTITTRTKESDCAWELSSKGIHPAAGGQGTTIDVAELFFKTPARRKFLKSDATEAAHCRAELEHLALAYPTIRFTLRNETATVLTLASQEMKERIRAIFGKSFAEASREVFAETSSMRIFGLAGLPSIGKTRTENQALFVNGRFVKDRLFMHAVKDAYADVLHHQLQPQYCLFLDIDPKLVDVNVHPKKSEVRFRDSQSVHRFVRQAVAAALAPALGAENQTQDSPKGGFGGQHSESHEGIYKPEILDRYLDLYTPGTSSQANIERLFSQKVTSEPQAPHEHFRLGRALGQIAGIFILAESSRGLVIVDMHAAHERIVYEKLKKALDESQIVSQQLVIPLVFPVSIEAMKTFEEHRDWFTEFGFDLRAVSETHLSLAAAPAVIGGEISKTGGEVILRMIDDIAAFGATSVLEEKRNRLLATIACHSAVRAHRYLSLPEMDALLREMEVTDRSGECNHGRPTFVELGVDELSSLFMRGK